MDILLRLFLPIATLLQGKIVFILFVFTFLECWCTWLITIPLSSWHLPSAGRRGALSLFFNSPLSSLLSSPLPPLEIILMYWMNILLVYMGFNYLLLPWMPVISIYINDFVLHISLCLLTFSLCAVFLISMQVTVCRSSPSLLTAAEFPTLGTNHTLSKFLYWDSISLFPYMQWAVWKYAT